MLKKGISATIFLAATSSIYAGGIEVAPTPIYVGGIYADVGISRNYLRDNFRSVVNYANVNSGQTSDYQVLTVNAATAGWSGFFGLGYNYVWDNQWSLGLEVFGESSGAKSTQWQTTINNNFITNGTGDSFLGNANVSLRLNQTWGISLLPGYYLASGSLLFLDIGVVNSQFQLAGFPMQYGNTVNLGFPTQAANLTGLRLGVGTKTQVGTHLAIGQEYIWESFDSFTATRTGINFLPENGAQARMNATNSVRISPEMEKMNLALDYYFARQGNAPDLSAVSLRGGGNFYIGANLGREVSTTPSTYRQVQNITTQNGIGITANSATTDNGLMNIAGWNLGLTVGWGYNFPNRWYLGAEVSGNYDNSSGQYRIVFPPITAAPLGPCPGGNLTTKLQKQADFALAVIPGFQVSDAALIYARIGLVGAQFQIQNLWNGIQFGDQYIFEDPALDTRISGTKTKWKNGLQLGVGADTILSGNLSLRTEFDVNNYGNFNTQDISFITNNGASTTTQTMHSAHRNIMEDCFNVSLIWHFFKK